MKAMPTRRVALLFAVTLFATQAMAERLPARFDASERSLKSLIVFPELKGDASARLLCASQVEKSGKMESTGCYVNTAGDEVYIKAIVKAAEKARMLPATIDGRPINVYVQFLVEFNKEGENQSVTVFNHPGVKENVDAYGVDHVAAQRGLTRETRQKQCPQHTRFAVWVKAHVAASGEQSSISVSPGEGPPITERCEQGIVATLQESRFTPARVDGEAVPSTFVEPFGN